MNDEIFQFDDDKGFWCEMCDGYTYLERITERHQFKLILEDEALGNAINNKADIKLAKRISVYRYPGGKTRIVDYLYNEMKNMNKGKLVSPFTGGGSFELAMLEAGIVEELHLNDLDYGVYSLYKTIKEDPDYLINKLLTSDPEHSDYFAAQEKIKNKYKGTNTREAAWTSLLVNRLAFSGIPKANPMGGKSGTKEKLQARWNPKELIRRINKIHSISDKYTITNQNAIELIEEEYWSDDTSIFIDPPYLLKGKELYNEFYVERDHLELSVLLDTLHRGFPGADVLVTYDFHKFIDEIFEEPEKEIINRKYSI